MSQDVGRGFLDAAASAFLRRRLLGQAKPLECSPRKTDALVVDGLRPHPVPRGKRRLMAIQSSGSMRRATNLGCGSGLEDS
jgi:hypothetical protein